MKKNTHPKVGGFSLIEVMIAVVVLSFGLISLAALQAELFRSGAEAKARANATSIAQQVVEDARSFAFVVAPTGYAGDTYMSLDTDSWDVLNVGGIDFTVDRDITRYRSEGAKFEPVAIDPIAVPFNAGKPEFKLMRVTVSWVGSDGDGTPKSVMLTDSIAAVSPADAAQLKRQALEGQDGPQVWIEPPNKGNPQVVPIAIGGDQSAASSNPKPQQFVEDVSAATQFSVMTFSGSTNDDSVLLSRKLDVAAVSCVCSDDGATSTATNPAYQATVWNGVQLAYEEPRAVPTGARIGTAVVSNADSEIGSMCTVCCRDHHENASRKPKPDPYRALVSGEASIGARYGYKKQGSSYNVGAGLLPSADVGGLYVDACQVIRVGGKMRMAVDAMQNNLLVTSLDDTGTGYRDTGFSNSYAGFVSSAISDGMASLPTGYPSPTARFPAPSAGRLTEYAGIVDPAAIPLAAKDEEKSLVAFGLYIDYLSEDTQKAYKCALDGDNTGDCTGLGLRSPLEVLPFYAVNVANLGSWNSAKPTVASVANATYTNQGLLDADGGLVIAQSGQSTTEFPVTIKINNSNSGLAGTAPVDFDDYASTNYAEDAQDFIKDGGSSSGDSNQLQVQLGQTSTLTLSTLQLIAGSSGCNYDRQTSLTTCNFNSPASQLSLQISNYTTEEKVKGQPVIHDRKICVASDNKIISVGISGDATTLDTTIITLGPLGSLDYTLTIDIVDESETCAPVTPAVTP